LKKLLIVILLFLSTSIFSQPYRSQYQYIKLTFSELMSTDGLFDKENYTVYDEMGDTVEVHGVGYEAEDDTTGGLTYVIIATDQWNYDIFHTVKVSWVKDRSGNLIAENNYAFTILSLIDSIKTPTTVHVGPESYIIDTLQVDSVYASGQENADHGPEKAIDNISYTTPGSNYDYNCWTSCCLSDQGGQWFVAKFTQDHFIQDLIVSGTYYHAGRVYGLEILISQDGISWETITNISTIPNVEWTSISLGRRAQFVKINFLTNSASNWAGLWELKVTGY